jgi:hypothetical protein
MLGLREGGISSRTNRRSGLGLSGSRVCLQSVPEIDQVGNKTMRILKCFVQNRFGASRVSCRSEKLNVD